MRAFCLAAAIFALVPSVQAETIAITHAHI